MFNYNIFTQTIYLFFMALLLAIIEVQIEGQHGWASKLPTWRPQQNSFFDRIYKKIMSGKPATGYHIAVFLFVLLILHYPFFSGLIWNFDLELQTLSLFFLFTVVWDFLWIIINPHYGIKKINVSHIWWHSKRLFGVPTDYYFALFMSFLLFIPLILKNKNYLIDWLITLIVFLVLTILVILLTPEERERWKED